MLFSSSKIHIIGGSGQMGIWLTNFFKNQGFEVASTNSKNAFENIDKADLIFICVPISIAPKIIEELNNKLKKGSSIIDLSSVMSQTSQKLKELEIPCANMHLLFGPNIATIQNQKIVLNIIKKSSLIESFKNLLEKIGAHVILMDEKTHDLQMAYIQCLIHFINLTLAKISLDNEIDLAGKISTPVFLTQIAALNRVISQNPSLLSEIQFSNPYSRKAIKELLDYQQKMFELISQNKKDVMLREITDLHAKLQPKKEEKKIKLTKDNTTLHIEKKHSIAYLGPKGTFSYQALKMLAPKAQTIECETIFDIFKAVSIDRADFGLVPGENSIEGTVRETFDFMIDFNLFSCLPFDLDIHQCLLSNEVSIKNLTKIFSHPQALGQTRKWISKNLPLIKIENSSSTLSALTQGLKKGEAVIGPEIAGKIYSLNTLAKNIEDGQGNTTRFYLISKTFQNIGNSNKTLLFLTIFNRVGILRDILDIFTQFGINLSKIESRPSREKVWDYHFFIEVESKPNNQDLLEALNVLKQYCPVIKILGSV